MARPHKQTVDYFPHDTDASEGKTLTIIENKYGNDGYAFWFKLLELLGKSSGHYYDFNNPADWEFLLAKTHQKDTETAKNILNTLSLLGAIDSELYENGIIWCQKFIERVSDAYNRTIEGTPKRPEIPVNVLNNNVSVDNNSKNNTLIPQTKLKETKLKETKLKETKLKETIIIPDFIDKELWNSFLEMRKKIKAYPTEKAVELIFKELIKLKSAGDNPNEVLKVSIMNNWKGVFPLKDRGNGTHQQNTKLPTTYTEPPYDPGLE